MVPEGCCDPEPVKPFGQSLDFVADRHALGGQLLAGQLRIIGAYLEPDIGLALPGHAVEIEPHGPKFQNRATLVFVDDRKAHRITVKGEGLGIEPFW